MRRTLALAAGVLLLILAAACGGDDAPSPTPVPQLNGIAVLKIDVAAAGGAASVTAVADVLAVRLNALGIPASAAETGADTMRVTFDSDRQEDEMIAVLSADIGFREPVIDADGNMVCVVNDGTEVGVNPLSVSATVGADGRLAMYCFDNQGSRDGEVKWQPAASVVDGQTVPFTSERIDSETVEATTGAGGTPTLFITFDEAGQVLFAEITRRLVNYPLGIFLGDQLLSAPMVNQEINSGVVQISGMTAEEAELLAAIVASGPLPYPVTVLNIQLP